jgi:hypothetical protein
MRAKAFTSSQDDFLIGTAGSPFVNIFSMV